MTRISGPYADLAIWRRSANNQVPLTAVASWPAWTHTFKGNLLYGRRQYRDAIAAFKRAIELMPTVACPYWCLADAYLAHGNFALAEVNYNRAVEVDPDDKKARQKLDEWNDRHASGA